MYDKSTKCHAGLFNIHFLSRNSESLKCEPGASQVDHHALSLWPQSSQRRELSTKSAVILPNSPNQEILILHQPGDSRNSSHFHKSKRPCCRCRDPQSYKINDLTSLKAHMYFQVGIEGLRRRWLTLSGTVESMGSASHNFLGLTWTTWYNHEVSCLIWYRIGLFCFYSLFEWNEGETSENVFHDLMFDFWITSIRTGSFTIQKYMLQILGL